MKLSDSNMFCNYDTFFHIIRTCYNFQADLVHYKNGALLAKFQPGALVQPGALNQPFVLICGCLLYT